MLQLLRRLAALGRDRKGVTAVEYGLLTALIALAIVSALNTTSGSLNATFATLSDHLTGAANASSTAFVSR